MKAILFHRSIFKFRNKNFPVNQFCLKTATPFETHIAEKYSIPIIPFYQYRCYLRFIFWTILRASTKKPNCVAATIIFIFICLTQFSKNLLGKMFYNIFKITNLIVPENVFVI